MATPVHTTLQSNARLTALDAFRGVTMMLMVIVNNPGDGRNSYAPLRHADWNGWTPTDVVFPSFVWIVGVAMTLALDKRLGNGAGRGELLPQALRRGSIIFGLGLLVYLFPYFDFSTMRVFGVLQRIGLCYFLCTAIYVSTGIRGQIAWIAGLLGGYWLLMQFAPVPGYGSGHFDEARNFAHYVDNIVLGKHNYAQTKTWDPEGIVSTLPAIATMLLGIMAGHVLRLKRSLLGKIGLMAAIGAGLMIAGYIVDIWLPINKKLWTSSFALVMAGLDFILLALFLWCGDVRGWSKVFRPAVIMGMNAIAVYMASELVDTALSVLGWREAIYRSLFVPLASPVNASLLFATIFMLLMYGIAYLLYKRNIFIRA